MLPCRITYDSEVVILAKAENGLAFGDAWYILLPYLY